MSENANQELPPHVKEVLDQAPAFIRDRVLSAMKDGAKVQIIELGEKDKKQETAAEPEDLCDHKEGSKKGPGSLLNLLEMLTRKPTTHEILMLAVTKAMQAKDERCAKCIEAGRLLGVADAPCLIGRSTAGVLLKGAVELSKDHPLAEKVKMITKVFSTDPEGVIRLLREYLGSND